MKQFYVKNNNNYKDIVSLYVTPNKLGLSLNCVNAVIKLSSTISHVGCYGNAKKQEGKSTCHAFLHGDLLGYSLTGYLSIDIHNQVIYDIDNASFKYSSGELLKEGDYIVFCPTIKKVYKGYIGSLLHSSVKHYSTLNID